MRRHLEKENKISRVSWAVRQLFATLAEFEACVGWLQNFFRFFKYLRAFCHTNARKLLKMALFGKLHGPISLLFAARFPTLFSNRLLLRRACTSIWENRANWARFQDQPTSRFVDFATLRKSPPQEVYVQPKITRFIFFESHVKVAVLLRILLFISSTCDL